MRRLASVVGITTLALAGGAIGASSATAGGLTVTGSFVNPQPGMRVIMVANDGTSVSAPVKTNGSFTLKVKRSSALKSMAPGKKKTGASLHLIKDGVYAGPFVLRKQSAKKATGRLAPTIKGKVALKKVTLKSTGFVSLKKKVSAKNVDTRNTMKLTKGVPPGAGTFGATGSLANNALRSKSMIVSLAELPKNAADLGSDADRDGIPNLADVDMNGDQILDAAQSDQPLTTASGTTLAADTNLENRPVNSSSFRKILNTSRQVTANSNLLPTVTWEQLSAFLKENLQFQALVTPSELGLLFCDSANPDALCPEALAVTSMQLSCPNLSYCLPNSEAIISASPGTGLDRQPLNAAADAPGVFRLPVDDHVNGATPAQQGFLLSFFPRVSDNENLLFVGDTFEFLFRNSDGSELSRQAKVLTSSVATPPEFSVIAGQTVTSRPDDQNAIPITGDATKVRFEFFRPQRLNTQAMDAASPQLIDRGGLTYSAYLIESQTNNFYRCRPEHITPSGGDLIALANQPQEPMPQLFDSAMNPANGGTLGFDVNVADCLANPLPGMNGSTPPPPSSGTTMVLELESKDSDANNTRSQAYVIVP